MPPERKDICDCGTLERCAQEPGHPIRFDARMNEYRLEHPRGRLLFYYCPFCGGRAPLSRRASFFAHVDAAEQARLSELLTGVETEREVRARFGRPDEETDFGVVSIMPEKDRQPAQGTAARQLKYTRLSPVAIVVFHAYGDGRVSRTWQAKPLPPTA